MRYGRAHFVKDAVRLGVPPEAAFSRTALRQRRDLLMHRHHPDRGGSGAKAAQVNIIYARMLAWLDAREAQTAAPNDLPTEPEPVGARMAALSDKLSTGAARAWGVALVAAAAYAALRHRRRT